MTGTKHVENTAAPEGLVAAAPVAKSKPQTIREFERALKGLGYSQREAASIAKGGFKAITTDEPEDLSELVALITRNISILKD